MKSTIFITLLTMLLMAGIVDYIRGGETREIVSLVTYQLGI